jgi:NAD(P)-dependent dehydrogenase (short-subunit alcohol dehydrogenase family)
MNDALKGKRLVIIGGTTGLGLSAARAFIANGARIVVVGRDQANVKGAKKQLGPSAIALAADARDPETAPGAIDALVSKWKRLDGLYHVAGGSGRSMGDGPLHDLADDGWRATLDLNLTALMLSNRAAVRQFLQQGNGGTILHRAILPPTPMPPPRPASSDLPRRSLRITPLRISEPMCSPPDW